MHGEGFLCSGTHGLRTASTDRCWLCTDIYRTVEKLGKLGHVVQKGFTQGPPAFVGCSCSCYSCSPEVFRPEGPIRICHYQCSCFCIALDGSRLKLLGTTAGPLCTFSLAAKNESPSVGKPLGRQGPCSGVGGAEEGVGRLWLWRRMWKPEKMVFGAKTSLASYVKRWFLFVWCDVIVWTFRQPFFYARTFR